MFVYIIIMYYYYGITSSFNQELQEELPLAFLLFLYLLLCYILQSTYLSFLNLILLDRFYFFPLTYSSTLVYSNFIVVWSSDKRSHEIPWYLPNLDWFLLDLFLKFYHLQNLQSTFWLLLRCCLNIPHSSTFFSTCTNQIKGSSIYQTPRHIIDCLIMHYSCIEFLRIKFHKCLLITCRVFSLKWEYSETRSLLLFLNIWILNKMAGIIFHNRSFFIFATYSNHSLLKSVFIPRDGVYSHWRCIYFTKRLSCIQIN